jgi:hypothetical protein
MTDLQFTIVLSVEYILLHVSLEIVSICPAVGAPVLPTRTKNRRKEIKTYLRILL